MARTVKPKTFGRITVASSRQGATAIERAVQRGQKVTVADVPAIVQHPRKAKAQRKGAA